MLLTKLLLTVAMGLTGLLALFLARPDTESNAAPAPIPVVPRASSSTLFALPGPAPLIGRTTLETVPAAATPCTDTGDHPDQADQLAELRLENDRLAASLADLRRQNRELLAARYESFRSNLSLLLARDLGADRLSVRVGEQTIDVTTDVRDILLQVAGHHGARSVEALRLEATDERILQTVEVLEVFYAAMLRDGRPDWDWRTRRLEAIYAAPIYRSRMR